VARAEDLGHAPGVRAPALAAHEARFFGALPPQQVALVGIIAAVACESGHGVFWGV